MAKDMLKSRHVTRVVIERGPTPARISSTDEGAPPSKLNKKKKGYKKSRID